MTSDGPRRSGMLRSPSSVIDRTCFSMRALRSAAGEGVDDGQALRAQRREQADGEAEDDDGDGSGQPDLRVYGQREVAAGCLRDDDAERRRDGEADEPPMTQSAAASASTKPSTAPSLNPSVFRIASSGILSRTLCAI